MKRLTAAAVVSLSAGLSLAVDTPPNPSVYYPNYGRLDSVKVPALDAPLNLNPEAKRLMNRFPGARPMGWRGSIIGFYGTPMTHGVTPAAAAADFVATHGGAFGAGPLQLVPTWDGELRDGRYHVFHYNQTLGGLPVEFGRFTVVVRTTPDDPAGDLNNRVVEAKGRLAAKPMGGFKPDIVTAETALDIAKTLDGFKDLTSWGQPEKVVYFGEGDLEAWITPIRAWKILGEIPGQPRKYSFFIDCATGEVAFVRGEVSFADVTGTVQGKVTPGSGCDDPSNPPVATPIRDISVVSGATSVFTDPLGAYTLSLAGAGPVTVSTTVGSGRWAQVLSPQELTTPILNESASALLPGTASFMFNNTPSEFSTAQINGFYYQTLTHNYFRSLTPLAWTAIDFQLPVYVNLNNSGGITNCNAYYDGASTNFFVAGGGCNNTAGGSVVSHEYGHHIVNQLGLAQGAFGEGFGDTMSMMIFDDAVIGRNFGTTGGVVRLPDSANIQYPCSGTEVHFCGQILGGVVWEIRKAHVNFFGTTAGVALVRQQHADWAMITDGGLGTASAHPQTAIDWLLVDDDNADVDDGTPNYPRIASAFGMHSIPVPPVVPIDIDLPDGLPESVRPGMSSAIRVRIQAVTETPNPSTAKLFYRDGSSGAFTETTLTPTVGDEYRAVVPTSTCGRVEYYFSVQSTIGNTFTSPSDAPANVYWISATDGAIWSPVASDDFESSNPAWTTSELSSGGTVTGQWERGDPNGTAAQPEDDHTATGVNCWFTGQGAVGGALGANDVDNGSVTLTSPAFDLSGAADGRFTYWLWYSNFTGASPDADVFTTEVSSDNGATWYVAEVVGPNTSQNFSGWTRHEFRLLQVPGVSPTSQVRVRFTADDAAPGSVVEAAIDDFVVERATCNLCLADLDDGSGTATPDGGVDVNDLLFFLTKFELGDIAVDLDNDGDISQALPDGGVDINDLLYFLAKFEGGC